MLAADGSAAACDGSSTSSAGSTSTPGSARPQLPVTHVTRRQGRPCALVLHKADALFAREQETRATDETGPERPASQRNPGA